MADLLSAVASIWNTSLTNKANRQMADLEYKRNLEMWNKQNEYNLPVNQMNRMVQAGLNPNLMYGQGNVGNAQTIPQYHAPRMEYNMQLPNVMDQLSRYLGLRMQQAQIDNVKATTDINRVEALYRGGFLFTRNQQQDAKTAIDMYNAEIAQAKYREMFQTGSGGMSVLKPQYAEAIRNKLISDLLQGPEQLAGTQQSVKSQRLENALKEMDLQFYKFDKYFNYGSRAIGSIPGNIFKKPTQVFNNNSRNYTDIWR